MLEAGGEDGHKIDEIEMEELKGEKGRCCRLGVKMETREMRERWMS